MHSVRRTVDESLSRLALLTLLFSLLVLATGCGTDSDNNGTEEDTLEVGTDSGMDATVETDMGELTLTAVDPSWQPGEQEMGCSICKTCSGDADCGSGMHCLPTATGNFCSLYQCDAGTCPGNSRCFDALNPETNRSTPVCLNGDADSVICPASYSCSPPEMPMDMDMEDMGELPSICPDGGVACVYCGDATGWVGVCPEDDMSPQCQVFRITNMERAAMGRSALRYDGQLAGSAQLHAIEMSTCDYFEHEALDGRTPFDRINDQGYEFIAAGENIAVGQQSSTEVMDAWMNSPGHRANILSPDFTEIGVGYYQGYWVQNFGRPQ